MYEKYNNQYKTSWEQTRTIAYIVAQVQNRKKLNPSDILSFDWDKKETKQSTDDIKVRMMQFQQMIENKKDIDGEVVTLDNFTGRKKDDTELSQSEKRMRQNELLKKYRK